MQIAIASPAEIDRIWPLVSDGIRKSCERGGSEFSAGHLWQLCRSGGAFLILVYDNDSIYMASVWRFQTDDAKHGFHCLALYGRRMRQWLEMAHNYISGIAKNNGATRMTYCGRSGWLRLFNATLHGDLYEVEI